MNIFAKVGVLVVACLTMLGCSTLKPTDPVVKVPSWENAAHASCWDGSNARKRMMNLLSPAFSEGKVDDYIAWMKSRGCDTAHLIVANRSDGEGGGYTIYGSSWSWKVDQNICNMMKARIKKLRANKFAVVIWLFTDDSSAYTKVAKANFPQYLNDLKAQGLLAEASTVVLGLELDEYFGASDVDKLAKATRAVYSGKIGTHHTSGKVSFAKFGDIVFYQVSPGKSASWIKAEAKRIKATTGKPLNFFEIERNPDRVKSQAAIDGGAYGVGNW